MAGLQKAMAAIGTGRGFAKPSVKGGLVSYMAAPHDSPQKIRPGYYEDGTKITVSDGPNHQQTTRGKYGPKQRNHGRYYPKTKTPSRNQMH